MRLRSVLAVLVSAAGVMLPFAGAAQEPLAPEDFAYAWPLTLGAGDLHRVTLPAEVYAAARAADLGDVRILDAQGRPVPRFVHVPEPGERAPRAPLPLPVFRVSENQREADVVARVTVETRAESPPASTSINLAVPALPQPVLPARWIAEVASHVERVAALRIRWAPVPGSFITYLRIETSDDLETWRSAGGGSIASFTAESGQIVRDRVPLSRDPQRYLRILPQDLPPGFELREVAIEFVPPYGEPERAWWSSPLAGDRSALEIDLGAAVPVDRVDLVPSVNTGLVHATLHSRAAPHEAWRRTHQAVFYRVGGIASSPADVPRTLARYWKIELSGGGAFAGEVRLGWRPAEVVFVAQGEPPFRLYAGSTRHAKPHPELARADDALRAVSRDKRLAAAVPAALGARETVSGEDAYALRARDHWRTWVLWTLLTAGVALVGWMAWRVARGLKRAQAAEPG